jgi:hypothetical protein
MIQRNLMFVCVLATCGCAMNVELLRDSRAKVIEVDSIKATNELLADQRLVALYGCDSVKAQEALERLGVPRPEAGRRILSALAAMNGTRPACDVTIPREVK